MVHAGHCMADVAAPLDTTSTAVASSNDATPSPSSTETSPPTTATAGDTAAAVWQEMQAAESGGTPPDAPQGPSPAQAARQPDGSAEDDESSLPTEGHIPVHRHRAVLTNTRKKLLAEFGIEESTGADGARSFNHAPDAVKTGVTLLKWLKDDPHGFMRMVQSQIGGDAITQTPKPAEKPVETPDPEPEPDIPLTDGRFVYSAQQQKAWMQWNARQERANAEREANEQRTLSEGRTREAQSLVAQAKQWPHFDKLRPFIVKMIEAQPKGVPLPPGFFQTAYITAYRQHGQNLLREEWEAERSGQLTRKADASTVQPGAPRPSTPRPDAELSSLDIARQEYRRHAAG